MSTDFPQKLPEKLRQLRKRIGLTPDELAPQVNAPNGAAIIGYENGTDIPVSVLRAYAKLSGLPIENLLEDNRDLWTGHLQGGNSK